MGAFFCDLTLPKPRLDSDPREIRSMDIFNLCPIKGEDREVSREEAVSSRFMMKKVKEYTVFFTFKSVITFPWGMGHGARSTGHGAWSMGHGMEYDTIMKKCDKAIM